MVLKNKLKESQIIELQKPQFADLVMAYLGLCNCAKDDRVAYMKGVKVAWSHDDVIGFIKEHKDYNKFIAPFL